MKCDIKEIRRISILFSINLEIAESLACGDSGPEIDRLKEIIPEGITDKYREMLVWIVEEAKGMSKEELMELVKQLPPCYLKFMLVDCMKGEERDERASE